MRKRACPVCGKHQVAAFRPFCSTRCADVDLNRWLTGGYSIESRVNPDDQEPAATEPNET